LVIPCDNIELKNAGGRGYSHLIYSDDAGATWKLGGITPTHNVINPNECAVAELSDGRLLINSRAGNNSLFSNLRVTSTSSDGGTILSPVSIAYGLVDPVCQGSLVSGDVKSVWTVFFSNAASTKRENMTVRMSIDDGLTWSKQYGVYSGPSAYSDMVILSEAQIAVFFECGMSNPYEGIAYKVVNISDFY
jgi:sialidase-1